MPYSIPALYPTIPYDQRNEPIWVYRIQEVETYFLYLTGRPWRLTKVDSHPKWAGPILQLNHSLNSLSLSWDLHKQPVLWGNPVPGCISSLWVFLRMETIKLDIGFHLGSTSGLSYSCNHYGTLVDHFATHSLSYCWYKGCPLREQWHYSHIFKTIVHAWSLLTLTNLMVSDVMVLEWILVWVSLHLNCYIL